jgi:hypothetical protein
MIPTPGFKPLDATLVWATPVPCIGAYKGCRGQGCRHTHRAYLGLLLMYIDKLQHCTLRYRLIALAALTVPRGFDFENIRRPVL